MNNDRWNQFFAVLLALAAAVRAWLMGPMWLDKAFLSLSYSDRIARGGGVLLAGQVEPYEAFLNPFWVTLFAVFGRFNLSETQLQAPIGILLYALLAVLVFRLIVDRCSTPIALIVTMLIGLAPVASAARDGSDAIFLAVLSLWSSSRVSRDLNMASERSGTAVLLGILVLSGRFAWLVAVGLAFLSMRKGYWKNMVVVVATTMMLVGFRWVLFGTWYPPVLAGPVHGLAAFQWLPSLGIAAVAGVAMAWHRKRLEIPFLWVLMVGVFSAWFWGHETGGFGVSMIPAVGVLLMFCAELLAAHTAVWFGATLGVLIAVVDGGRTETTVSAVQHERLTNFHQGRGMGRFLLWRFEEDDQIVVHRPGVIGYYARRSLIDLSGVLHGRTINPSDALIQDPVAVLPARSIVSQKAQRIPMGTEWPQALEDRYKQYAIQHQKQWEMVDVNPVWFHIYIRKDLPMLRPEIPKSNGNILPQKDPFWIKE